VRRSIVLPSPFQVAVVDVVAIVVSVVAVVGDLVRGRVSRPCRNGLAGAEGR
jgi:hypothetical protein